MTISELKDEIVIDENEKQFNIYRKLPLIISSITLLACFILGIVFACVSEEGIILLFFWISGIAGSAINYYLLKLLLSYKILNIYYMKRIIAKIDNLQDEPSQKQQEKIAPQSKVIIQQNKASQSSVSYHTWTCPKCGEKNNGAAKNCINCFEPRP